MSLWARLSVLPGAGCICVRACARVCATPWDPQASLGQSRGPQPPCRTPAPSRWCFSLRGMGGACGPGGAGGLGGGADTAGLAWCLFSAVLQTRRWAPGPGPEALGCRKEFLSQDAPSSRILDPITARASFRTGHRSPQCSLCWPGPHPMPPRGFFPFWIRRLFCLLKQNKPNLQILFFFFAF